MNLLDTFDNLVNTLTMLSPDFEDIGSDKIKDYLEELEGDYYSFLDHDVVTPLRDNGLLNDIQTNNIVKLKSYR